MDALVLYLRVNGMQILLLIGLPELTSIQLGTSSFFFNDVESSELIMRSKSDEMNWWIDLPRLVLLTTTKRSQSFRHPRSITLEGIFIKLLSQTDIPSLITATLSKAYAFSEKKTIHTNSISSSSLSFLDITPALQQYLQFIVSFTILSHPNTKSPFSLHTTVAPFLPHYHSFYSYQYIACHAVKHSFTIILSFHSNPRDQPKHSLR